MFFRYPCKIIYTHFISTEDSEIPDEPAKLNFDQETKILSWESDLNSYLIICIKSDMKLQKKTKSKEITLTDLPAGKWTFEVRAEKDGAVSEKVKIDGLIGGKYLESIFTQNH